MAMAGPGAAMGMAGPEEESQPLTPFSDPTQRPDEPGQSGASMGPGMGPEALGLSDPAKALDDQDIARLTDMLPFLEFMANQPGAMPSTRQLVRRIKSSL